MPASSQPPAVIWAAAAVQRQPSVLFQSSSSGQSANPRPSWRSARVTSLSGCDGRRNRRCRKAPGSQSSKRVPDPDLPAHGIDLHASRVYSKSSVKSQPGEETAGIGGVGAKHGERFENRSPKSLTDLPRRVFVGAALKRGFDDQALVDSPAAERGENLCCGGRIGLPNDIV